jgi:hypothetical protein
MPCSPTFPLWYRSSVETKSRVPVLITQATVKPAALCYVKIKTLREMLLTTDIDENIFGVLI